MLFEFNILLVLIKKHLADLSMAIDAGLIVYTVYLKRELNKKTSKEDLMALKEHISQLLLHELKSTKEQTIISTDAINQRITDLQITLLTEINSIRN
jgi:hypothetical protein